MRRSNHEGTVHNLDDHLGNGLVIENTYGSIVAANMIEECAGHAGEGSEVGRNLTP